MLLKSLIKWGMRVLRFFIASIPVINIIAVWSGANDHKVVKCILAILFFPLAWFFAWRWIWSGFGK